MKKFTVLLQYPDVFSPYGQETYMANVEAEDVKCAQRAAQRVAQEGLVGNDELTVFVADPDDYFVLMVIEGHHYDIKEAS